MYPMHVPCIYKLRKCAYVLNAKKQTEKLPKIEVWIVLYKSLDPVWANQTGGEVQFQKLGNSKNKVFKKER